MVNSRKRKPLPATFLVWLAAGLLARNPNNFTGKTSGQELPRWPKFYALQLVFGEKVQNADDSLGEPDGRFAEILPGGQLVVLMEKKMLSRSRMTGYGEDQGCTDSGSVVGKGEDHSLEGRFTWQDAHGEKRHEWVRLVPTATGFCFAAPVLEDSSGVDMVRIINTGKESLFVDAVIGFEWVF